MEVQIPERARGALSAGRALVLPIAAACAVALPACGRTEPAAESGDFEAIDLAAIEFDNPDLPWMFTPAAADAQGRLRPWMCLVVVRQTDGVRLRPAASEPLPVLEIAAPAKLGEELPDLAESWAWAHAQVSWPQRPAPPPRP